MFLTPSPCTKQACNPVIWGIAKSPFPRLPSQQVWPFDHVLCWEARAPKIWDHVFHMVQASIKWNMDLSINNLKVISWHFLTHCLYIPFQWHSAFDIPSEFSDTPISPFSLCVYTFRPHWPLPGRRGSCEFLCMWIKDIRAHLYLFERSKWNNKTEEASPVGNTH